MLHNLTYVEYFVGKIALFLSNKLDTYHHQSNLYYDKYV